MVRNLVYPALTFAILVVCGVSPLVAQDVGELNHISGDNPILEFLSIELAAGDQESLDESLRLVNEIVRTVKEESASIDDAEAFLVHVGSMLGTVFGIQYEVTEVIHRGLARPQPVMDCFGSVVLYIGVGFEFGWRFSMVLTKTGEIGHAILRHEYSGGGILYFETTAGIPSDEETIQAYEESGRFLAISHDQTAAVIYSRIAELLSCPEEKNEFFTEAVHLGVPEPGTVFNNRGVLHYEAGDYGSAIADFSRALDFDPQRPTYIMNRANAFLEAGKYRCAIEDYTQTIRLEHRMGDAYQSRGDVLRRIGDFEGAIRDYSAALEHGSETADLRFGIGVALHHLGEQEEAVGSFSRTLVLEPEYPNAHYNRGTTLYSLGEYRCAIEDFSSAIGLNPSHGPAISNRAIARALIEDFSGALADANSAIAIDPDHAVALYIRGFVNYRFENIAEAREDMSRSCALGSTAACDFLRTLDEH